MPLLQHNWFRNAAMKQKGKEELLLLESEPMPDLTQEYDTEQCEFFGTTASCKISNITNSRSLLLWKAAGIESNREELGKIQNTAGVKKPDWKAALLTS